MTDILLDFSQRRELVAFARIIADVQAVAAVLKVPTMITGAFARDLHIYYAHGINTRRQTEDVDFGLAVRDWPTFTDMKKRLIEARQFREVPGVQQRLRHVSDLPIDLVPFAGVETGDRQVDWPPAGELRMNMFGFSEALATAQPLRMPDGVEALVVSLPALAMLKIVAWQDRHYRAPKKDAHDLMLIATNYLDLGNEERLWGEFLGWTDADDFDTRHAGARMLGIDIRRMIDQRGRDRLAAIIAEQADAERPGLLPQEMSPHEPMAARAFLQGILDGLIED